MDPVAFDLRNASGKASAYIATDPATNVLTLTVTNRSASDLKLNAGAPVPEAPPDGGPTSLYVSFGDLVAATAIPDIKIAADGWQAEYFSDPAPAIALTPTKATVLADSGGVSFSITNIPVAGPPRPSSVTVDYYGMGTLDASSGTAPLMIENAPSAHKSLRLDHGFVSDPIAYITADRQQTPIKNTLIFHFTNPAPPGNPAAAGPLVPDNTPWGPNPPVFLLSFVPGMSPGYGALSTLDRMKDIKVGLAQVYQDQWTVKQPDDSAPTPVWSLFPQKHEILGTDAAATVEFRITELVTALSPGLTQMYLQYSNIPGYDDGYLTLQIEKKMPSPGILQFLSLTPGTIKRGDPVTLAWQTFDAASLKLTWIADGLSKELDAPDDIPFSGSCPINPPPVHDTTFTLEVFDYNNSKVQDQVTISVVEPPPRIHTLTTTTPRANLQDRGSAKGAITLKWTLEYPENASQLRLISLDADNNEVDQGIDTLRDTFQAHVYRSGGVPFRLRIESKIKAGDYDEKVIVVETWEDAFTMTEVPTGTIVSYGGHLRTLADLQSRGWLICDGGYISRVDYPELFSTIGTTYGGDGNPNFALPDLRGMVLRGCDVAAGRDAGGSGRFKQGTNQIVGDAPGSWQLDQGISTAFGNNEFDSETRSKNVSVFYMIASGVKNKPGPPAPAPYVASPMIAATMLTDGTIAGVGKDNQLYTRPNLFGGWTLVPNSGSVIGVSQLKDGRIVGVGTNNQLYLRDTINTAWTQILNSGAVMAITVLQDGRILGVGLDYFCYLRDTPTSGWVQIPSSGSISAVIQRPDGKLLAVTPAPWSGTDGNLWVRNTLTSGWMHIPNNTGNMIGLAQLAYGVILGVGADNQLYTRASLTAPWVKVGG